jgi:hypothetical protein
MTTVTCARCSKPTGISPGALEARCSWCGTRMCHVGGDEWQSGLERAVRAGQEEPPRSLSLAHIAADPDFAEAIATCDRILAVKGHDYTQGGGRLKNFFRNGSRLGLPAEKVLAVYMFKHLDAIETFLMRGAVESEPIEGRIFDAINYLLLLFKMVKQRRRDSETDAAKAVQGSAT